MDFNSLYNQKAFQSVDRNYARALFKNSALISLFPDEYLFHQGAIGRGIYFVLKGSMNVILEIEQENNLPNKELILDTLEPGTCFGEICFLEEQPRTASVKAAEFCECIYLDRQVLSNGLRLKDINAYQLNVNLGRMVASRLGKLNQKIYELCKSEPSFIDKFSSQRP
ncbi:cyclic nucleotide-binding domain-containing protein [Legionella sp. CNM-4043-24]|uniref:cyclic nucleotide-binding domain-containing protein n=1 Tax=Legionella sp. CNM-4043-24 TaxID=3421646 RepID=UPI00403AD0D9